MPTTPASRQLIALPLILSLMALASCGPPAKPESRKQASDEAAASAKSEAASEPKVDDSATPASGRAITAADRESLATFGEAYATAMSEGDAAVADHSWDWEALLALAIGDSAAKAPEAAAGIKRGFLDGAKKRPGGMMWASFGTPWRMLRVHEIDGEWRVLYRAIDQSGVSYLDLVPRLDHDGSPEFIDAYVFSSGEKLSETLARFLLPQIAQASKTPIGRLLTEEDPVVKHVDQFISISRATQQGDFEGVIAQYAALPPELQDNKTILLMYLGAASKLMSAAESEAAIAAYQNGVERFERKHGDDPAFLLVGIDYHFLREDFESAAELVEKLDVAVGGDPYLDFFRASILLNQEKFTEALPFVEKARDNNPELEDPYWGIVNVHLSLENYAEVAKGLDQLAEKFGYEFDLAADPLYADFLASPEGEAWLAKQPAPEGDD